MVKISLIASLAVLSTVAHASFLQAPIELEQSANIDVQTQYIFACIRGGLAGFTTGLYDNSNETVSSECLGQTTYNHLVQYWGNVMSGDIMQIFKSFGVIYQLGFDIQKTCRTSEIGFEIAGFMLNKTNGVTINSLVTNFQNNIFKLTGAANNIAAVVVDQYTNWGKIDYTKINDATDTFTDLGKSIGQIARTIMGFTKKNSSGGRKPKQALTTPHPFFDFEE